MIDMANSNGVSHIPTIPSTTESSSTLMYKRTYKLQAALSRASGDFRSDVVTVPTEATMQAIIDASFGDLMYDEDGDDSVNALQDKLVSMTGMEAALWTPSGTMGNQICLRTHLQQPPHSVLDYRAHVHCWESGSLAVLSQATSTCAHPCNGIHLTLEDVKKRIISDGNIHFPPTRVVSLENTLDGIILPLKDAQEISKYVRNYPTLPGQPRIAMHLDGARLFDAVIAEGVSIKDYCACFDSVSICLSKGIGAPMGSVILGSKSFIERAKWYRKMFGGGVRQPGMMAAAASSALDQSLPMLSRVHELVKRTAAILEAFGYRFTKPVRTNMIFLDLELLKIPQAAFVDYCKAESLLVMPSGRLVFHHQISEHAVSALVKALKQLMDDLLAGKEMSHRKVHGGYSN